MLFFFRKQLFDLKDAKINNLTQQYSTRDYFNILRKKNKKCLFRVKKISGFVEKKHTPTCPKS